MSAAARAPPATPTARPTAISTTNSSTTVQIEASSCVASSTIPIIRAIPTGSLKPDSPSRIVPDRPLTSLPGEHREGDGGVGRRQRRADEPGPSRRSRGRSAPPTATSAAVPNVPEHAEREDRRRARPEAAHPDVRAALEEDHDERERRDPLDVLEASGRSPSRSTRSDAAAAATRSRPAVGTARRPATIRTPIASSSAPEAKRITRPKSTMSSTATILHCRPAGRAGSRGAAAARARRRLAPSRRPLTLSLRPSHPAPTRRPDTSGTHACRASVCPRLRARRPRRVGGSEPCRDPLDRERTRHGRAHREGDRDRPARAGRREDRRPLAARPVEPTCQRRAARADGLAARQGRQLLRPRRALQDHRARRGVLDLRPRPGQRRL